MEISLSELISLLNQNTSLIVHEVIKEVIPILEQEPQEEKIHNIPRYETEGSFVGGKNIGENIKQMRNKKGWTQTELAKKVGTGTSMIGHIERGVKIPSLALALSLAQVFDCTVEDMCVKKEDN